MLYVYRALQPFTVATQEITTFLWYIWPYIYWKDQEKHDSRRSMCVNHLLILQWVLLFLGLVYVDLIINEFWGHDWRASDTFQTWQELPSSHIREDLPKFASSPHTPLLTAEFGICEGPGIDSPQIQRAHCTWFSKLKSLLLPYKKW